MQASGKQSIRGIQMLSGIHVRVTRTCLRDSSVADIAAVGEVWRRQAHLDGLLGAAGEAAREAPGIVHRLVAKPAPATIQAPRHSRVRHGAKGSVEHQLVVQSTSRAPMI